MYEVDQCLISLVITIISFMLNMLYGVQGINQIIILSYFLYLAWFEHGLGFGDVARRLERHVALGRPVEHAEEVVV